MKPPDLSRRPVFAPQSSVCIINNAKLCNKRQFSAKLFDMSAASTEHATHSLIFGCRTVVGLKRCFDDWILSCKLSHKGAQR